MKKILLVTVAALTLAFAMVGMASANGGPHGGYDATTDACAGCHRAHTAIGARLLVQDSTYNLCISCHGNGGTGANTNVQDGYYLSSRDDAPTGANGNVGATNTADTDDQNVPGTPTQGFLLGGGFDYYMGVATTSSHDPSGATAAAWGNGANRGFTGNLADGNLTCASCHDPHGNTNYRMIKTTLNSATVAAARVDEDAAKDYDDEHWGTGTSGICAACHSAYHMTNAGQGSTVDAGTFTHRIDVGWNDNSGATYVGVGTANPESVGYSTDGGVTTYNLPLAETGAGDMLVCMTCHLPHGTAAQMSGFAAPAFDPSGTLGPIPAGDSSLLRLDNRGVCEVCHQK